MIINKSQMQSLSYIELFLSKSVFTYRQLYVAISIVKSKKRLNILILDENENMYNIMKNVIYQDVFQKI